MDPDRRRVGAGHAPSTATRPDGTADSLVRAPVRRRQPARRSARRASHEYQLLTLLRAAGLPVPRPRLRRRVARDPARAVPGHRLRRRQHGDRPRAAHRAARRTSLASSPPLLAGLHQAALRAVAMPPTCPTSAASAATKLGTWPTSLDEALSEAAVRAALTRSWPPPHVNRAGAAARRLLARQHAVAGRHARLRHRLGGRRPRRPAGRSSANARMEIAMAAAMPRPRATSPASTGELMPALDLTALPHWDLYAALRHAGRMTGWGLTAARPGPPAGRRIASSRQRRSRGSVSQPPASRMTW